LGVSLLLAPRAQAEFDAEKYLVYGFGDLSLKPRLDVSESYDSNLFYAETDTVDDFITRIRPGLTLTYGTTGENFSSITYLTDITRYAERGDLDYLGHIVEHRARFVLGRLTITGNDNFASTRSTLGGTFSYLQRPVGLMNLRDQWRVDYDISPKAVVGIDAGYEWIDYDAKDLGTFGLYDFQGFSGGIRAGYVPSDRIVVYPQFTYHRNVLDANQPSVQKPATLSAYGINMGAQGEFTAKLTGTISGGYEFREYEDGTPVPDGWVANMSLRWQIRAKTAATLSYRHWIQVARDAQGTAFSADRPSVGLTQQLGTQGRWNVAVDGYIQFHDYGDGFLTGATRIDRSDDLAGCSVTTSYRWTPWLTTSAAYDFSTYSDNVQGIPDYEVHRFSLRVVAGY
jgi:hypothetical protein